MSSYDGAMRPGASLIRIPLGAATVLAFLANPPFGNCQSPIASAINPKFVSISVQAARDGPQSMGCRGTDGQLGDSVPEQGCRATAASFQWITALAYDVPVDRIDALIVGAPSWFGRAKCNLEAGAGQPATIEQLKLMLQAWLAERLKLRLHRVTEESAGYALVLNGNGRPELRPAKDRDHGVGNILHERGSLAVYNGTPADLATALSAVLDKPVLDRTGIDGFYDFALTWKSVEVSAISAALEAQLGLRLKPDTKIPSKMLVIDHVEDPLIQGEIPDWPTVRTFAAGCARVEAAAGQFFTSRGLVSVADRSGLSCGSHCLGAMVSSSIDAKHFRDKAGSILDFEGVQRAYIASNLYQPNAGKALASRGRGFWEHMGPWWVSAYLQYRDREGGGCQAQFDFSFARHIEQYLLILPIDSYALVLRGNGQLEAEAFAAVESAVGPGRDVSGRLEMETRQTQLQARLESEAASARPGAPGNAIEFVRIQPGVFMAGCDATDTGCPHEAPAHRVEISKAFEMGRFEVTQAQWEAVVGTNPSHFKGANLPVETVTWDEIQSFLEALNARRDGYRYRLPTEDEWEYAARAGSGSAAPPDVEATDWLYSNSNGHTHPVGQKQANAWGLYDMLGNVAEFVQDEYLPPLRKAGSGAGFAQRVTRGGSFQQGEMWARASARDGFGQKASFVGIGFRCAREPVSKESALRH